METSPGKRDLMRALYVPLMLLWIIWTLKGVEVSFGASFGNWGIYPRTMVGLRGILFAPLIHSDFHHLVSNTVPFLLLTTAIFYFYRPLAFRIFALIWIVSGICVWIGGRNAYHIGASGLIYGEASFLFFSGILRRDVKLVALSFLIIFLYGGMVWGVFPFFPEISWESHLFGGLSGLAFALIYRKEGPQKPVIEEDDNEELPEGWDELEITDEKEFRD